MVLVIIDRLAPQEIDRGKKPHWLPDRTRDSAQRKIRSYRSYIIQNVSNKLIYTSTFHRSKHTFFVIRVLTRLKITRKLRVIIYIVFYCKI